MPPPQLPAGMCMHLHLTGPQVSYRADLAAIIPPLAGVGGLEKPARLESRPTRPFFVPPVGLEPTLGGF